MVKTFLFLLLSSASYAITNNALVDEAGSVLRVSSDTLVSGGGATAVSNISAAPPAPDVLDEYGRCKWRFNGSTVVPQAPRWPAAAALKRAAAKRLRDALDRVLVDIVALERWQSDPANVAVIDRAQELTAAQAKFEQLRDVLAGN